MVRLPFNPDRIPTPPSPAKPARSAPLTVSQVAALLRTIIADHAPAKLRVIGEVSNLSQRGHAFFSLKDEAAAIRCVAFASSARKWKFPLADGMQVIATGRLDYYDAQGSLQLYVDNLEPVGQGALELRFRALCEELRRLGYFDDDRKKPLPAMPQCVAVVTSRTGAALQDVINTTHRRWAGCRLLLFDVRVQGEAAAPEIAAALNALSRHGQSLGIDAIILTRGGGSIEDLWAFNERIVADAIFNCTLPIVAAIGHETDTTIAELVADRRCSTPTQAAMTLIPDRAALAHQLTQLSHRLALVLRRRADAEKHRLAAIAKHAIFRRPLLMLDPHRDRLTRLSERLNIELPHRLRRAHDRLAALARQLAAIGPTNVLARGYSYTLDPAGRVLLDPAQVHPGDPIVSVLAKGRLTSRVEPSAHSISSTTPPGPNPKSEIPSPASTVFDPEAQTRRELAEVKSKILRRKTKPSRDSSPSLFDA